MKYRLTRKPPRKRTALVLLSAATCVASLAGGVAWAQQAGSTTRAAEEPIVLIDQTWTNSGIRLGSEAIHRCPPNQVMTGVRGVKYEDRVEIPGVQCAVPVIGEHATANAAVIGTTSKSDWLEPVSNGWIGHSCGGEEAVPLIASVHDETTYARMQVRCAEFVAESKADRSFPGGPLDVRAVRSEIVDATTQTGLFTVRCPDNMAVTGRSQLHGADGAKAKPYPDKVEFTCTAWKAVTR